MNQQQPINIEKPSRFSDIVFNDALAASARGLAGVSGGRDYSEDSWIPFSERLKVFGKSSRQRIGAISREQSGPDLTNPTAQGRYNPCISESQNLSGDGGVCREARLLQVQQIDLLIDTVTRAVASFP